MNWTTEYPTTPGYYWIRNFRSYGMRGTLSARGEIVEVFELIPGAGLTVFFIGHGETIKVEGIKSAEWQGPIEPQQ